MRRIMLIDLLLSLIDLITIDQVVVDTYWMDARMDLHLHHPSLLLVRPPPEARDDQQSLCQGSFRAEL
jgi:hypothetical protein